MSCRRADLEQCSYWGKSRRWDLPLRAPPREAAWKTLGTPKGKNMSQGSGMSLISDDSISRMPRDFQVEEVDTWTEYTEWETSRGAHAHSPGYRGGRSENCGRRNHVSGAEPWSECRQDGGDQEGDLRHRKAVVPKGRSLGETSVPHLPLTSPINEATSRGQFLVKPGSFSFAKVQTSP